MVHAKCCAPYPKQPCIVHETNMWCPYCMMSSVLKSSTNSPESCDLSYDFAIRWLLWPYDQSTLTLVVLKINQKENKNEKKNKPSLTSLILTIDGFDILEILGDLVDLLLQLGWDWGGIFSMLAGIGLSAVLLLWLDSGIILGVSLSKIFFLREIVFLSAIRESYLDWYTEEMRFQITSPIPLLSQIRYSLVVILGLNSVSGVQYKNMIIDR